MDEALALHRRLAAADRYTHEPDLAVALSAWGTLREQVDDLPGAIAADAEAVTILERHVVARPRLVRAHLARVQLNRAVALECAGHTDRAVTSAVEAANHYHAILAVDDGVPSPEIHDAIRDVAAFLSTHDHAVAAGDLLADLARRLRAAGDRRLARTLHDLAITLVHQDELDRASEVLTEAVAAHRILMVDHGGDDAELANVLYLYAMVNAGRGERLHEALAAGEEAAELFANLAHGDPHGGGGAAAEAEVAALDVVQLLLLLLGRDDDAAAVARRRTA